MSRLLPIALLAIAALAAAAWMFTSGGEPPRPLGDAPGATDDGRREVIPVDPESSQRVAAPGTDRPTPEPEVDASSASPSDDRPAPAPPDPAATPTGRVIVNVHRAGTGEPIADFRLVRHLGLAHLPIESPGRDGRFVIADVELGAAAEIVVEAEDFTPSDPVDVSLTRLETEREVRVDLVPASRGSGVIFLVRDSDLLPLPYLRIIAWRRPLDAPSETDRTRAWTRLAANPEGRFELPDLEVGDYRFELGAVTEDGEIRLQQPALVDVEWRGGGRDERAVDLKAGAGLELTVLHPDTRQPLANEVALRLEDFRGEHVPIRFGHREEDRTLIGNDTLPHAGPCRLDAPLPPGRYLLKCQLPGGDVVERDLFLSVLQEARVTLP